VCDTRDDHKLRVLVDRVDDAVVADADPIVIPACELDSTWRAWILGEGVDGGFDPIPKRRP
jgi:hypothetical protein